MIVNLLSSVCTMAALLFTVSISTAQVAPGQENRVYSTSEIESSSLRQLHGGDLIPQVQAFEAAGGKGRWVIGDHGHSKQPEISLNYVIEGLPRKASADLP